MSLLFNKLRYKNFLSSGNTFTEFDFTRNKSTLVVGNNGSGKSTFIDALVFGLYGKAYRKINKPQLINSINGKDLLVEVEFKSGTNEYMIRRGVKPNVFEIHMNGSIIGQDASIRDYQENLELNILKIGYRSFNQIVVLGSAQHVPFMQLPTHTRREVIEDLLDIQVFSIMNNLLKERVQSFKEKYTKNEMDLQLIDSKIEMTKKHLKELEEADDCHIKEEEMKILGLKKESAELEKKKIELETEMLSQADTLAHFDQYDFDDKFKELRAKEVEYELKIKALKKELKFYEKNKSCPSCRRPIGEKYRTERINEIQKDSEDTLRAEQDTNLKLNKGHELFSRFDDVRRKIADVNSQLQHQNVLRTLLF